MPTEKKIRTVAELQELLAQAQMAVSAAYLGLTVAEMNRLRRALRSAGLEAHVVKNRLFEIAASQAGRPEAAALAEGPTMIVFARNDVVAAAKAITEYVRTSRNAFQPRKAYLSGQVLDARVLQELAELPPREAMLGQLAGALMSPVARLKGLFDRILTNPAGSLLNGVLRETAGLLEARARQLEAGA